MLVESAHGLKSRSVQQGSSTGWPNWVATSSARMWALREVVPRHEYLVADDSRRIHSPGSAAFSNTPAIISHPLCSHVSSNDSTKFGVGTVVVEKNHRTLSPGFSRRDSVPRRSQGSFLEEIQVAAGKCSSTRLRILPRPLSATTTSCSDGLGLKCSSTRQRLAAGQRRDVHGRSARPEG